MIQVSDNRHTCIPFISLMTYCSKCNPTLSIQPKIISYEHSRIPKEYMKDCCAINGITLY